MKFKKQFSQILKQYQSFAVTTHKYGDGDGLGAGAALTHGLKKLGKQARFFTLESLNTKYQFLNIQNIIKTLSPSSLKKNHCILAVDVNDTKLIGSLYSQALKKNLPVVFIDHHPILKKLPSCHYLIDTKASSTGEIVYSLLKSLKIPLDKNIATALYTSIVFDTKRFKFVKNSPVPFQITANLIPHIPNVTLIHEKLSKNLSLRNLKLYDCLKNTKYYCKKKVAVLFLTKKELQQAQSDIGMACNLIDLIMNISHMEMGVLILETGKNQFKLSFRSRKKDILPLAKKWGGGGHNLSAGAYVTNTSVIKLQKTLLQNLKASIK